MYLEDTVPYNVLHVYPVPISGVHPAPPALAGAQPVCGVGCGAGLANGYQRAFQFNLALELAPQYGVEPSPLILRTAEESKRALYPTTWRLGACRLDPRRPVGV